MYNGKNFYLEKINMFQIYNIFILYFPAISSLETGSLNHS